MTDVAAFDVEGSDHAALHVLASDAPAMSVVGEVTVAYQVDVSVNVEDGQ